MNTNQKQQKIAQVITDSMISSYKLASAVFPGPAGQLTLSMGMAMVGITASAQLVLKHGVNKVPDRDGVLFACLLIANSAEFANVDEHNDALAVEFSFDHVLRTIDQFREITGRSIEGHLNESLIEEVNIRRAKAAEAILASDLPLFKSQ